MHILDAFVVRIGVLFARYFVGKGIFPTVLIADYRVSTHTWNGILLNWTLGAKK